MFSCGGSSAGYTANVGVVGWVAVGGREADRGGSGDKLFANESWGTNCSGLRSLPMELPLRLAPVIVPRLWKLTDCGRGWVGCCATRAVCPLSG